MCEMVRPEATLLFSEMLRHRSVLSTVWKFKLHIFKMYSCCLWSRIDSKMRTVWCLFQMSLRFTAALVPSAH